MAQTQLMGSPSCGPITVQNQINPPWQALPTDPSEPIGQPAAVTYQQDLLYIAFGETLHDYQVHMHGFNWLGQIPVDHPISDLDLYEGFLIASGNQETVTFIKLETGNSPFGQITQLPIGGFSSVTTATPELFFGISAHRGLEQFRPNTSFRKTASLVPDSQVLDVAFADPFAFLATEDSLELCQPKIYLAPPPAP